MLYRGASMLYAQHEQTDDTNCVETVLSDFVNLKSQQPKLQYNFYEII